ncbi:M1 family peptidase, partial [Streptomyces lavendulocolor]
TLAVTVPQGLRADSPGSPAPDRTSAGRTTYTGRTTDPLASYRATPAIGRYETRTFRTPERLPVHTAARGEPALLAQIPELLAWDVQK